MLDDLDAEQRGVFEDEEIAGKDQRTARLVVEWA